MPSSVDCMGDGRSWVADPPRHWMISEEAIRARAAELSLRDDGATPEQNLRQAEAEFRAAAGLRTRSTAAR